MPERTVRAWGSDKENFKRNLAVIIGIDRYEKHPAIRNLTTAVHDANAIADLLEKDYDYKPANVIRIVEPEEATLDKLQHLFNTRLHEELNPGEDDRLIIYLAGHGLARSKSVNSNDYGPEGYLVPHDADPAKQDSFLSMREVSEALDSLKCHHLLVILDCCFAGTFRWAGSRASVPILETIRQEHYYHFIRHPAWQVITSSAHDQEALDVARLQEDNRQPVPGPGEPHSPFALALLEGLQPGDDSQQVKADLFSDGVVTAHELFVYLQNRVKELSNNQQAPGIYPLRREYDRGEFVFTPTEFDPEKLAEALPLNEENNPYRGLNSFDEKHAEFFFGRQTLVNELAERLSTSGQALTVVLGVSGSGKSSLVKAGLIPHLRNLKSGQQAEQQPQQWYILNPMRPGELPFRSLGRTLLPLAKTDLLEQVAQVSFLDEFFKPMLKARTEAKQNSISVAQERQGKADETIMKVADSWCSATPEAKLLLIEDYFAQLETLGNPQQQEQLKALYDRILIELDSVSQHLQQDSKFLSCLIATWNQKHSSVRLLLVIDQFEELLTRSQDDREDYTQTEQQEGDHPTELKEWQKFLEVLRLAIKDHAQTLRLVLTLRSDFEPRFLSSALEPYWKDARFPVRAMTSDELRQAIENPALKQALYFEESKGDRGNFIGNLVSKLVDEVGQMPGALPLLSFTLSELYVSLYKRWQHDQSTDRTLRFEDYKALGGVAGALTRRATQEYDSLDKNHQATMRRVMLRMVAIEGGVARRQVLISELIYPNQVENDRVRQVIERLVSARLLVKGQETGEPYVEAAHDFLVRGWDKLQDWIQQEQANLFLQQRLSPAAIDWERNHQDIEYLWIRDPRLALLEKILESETNNWLNGIETKFVQKSKDRRQDELEETKRQLRISEERRVKAELREKAGRFSNLFAATPTEGLVLAVAAMGQNMEELPGEILNPITANLQEATRIAQKTIIFRKVFYGGIYSVAFSPDGKRTVFGGSSKDGYMMSWGTSKFGDLFKDQRVFAKSVAFSPNGKLVASLNSNNTVCLWDLEGNLVNSPIQLPSIDSYHGSKKLVFSPDGACIICAVGNLYLLNLQGEFIDSPLQSKEGCRTVVISPDGQLISTTVDDHNSQIWNLKGEVVGKTLEAGFPLAFSPDGEWILGISLNELRNTLYLWDLQGNKSNIIFQGHTDWIRDAAFSPDGTLIVSGGADRTVRLWDLSGNEVTNPFKEPDEIVASVAFSPCGKYILCGCDSMDSARAYLWRYDSVENALQTCCDYLRDTNFFNKALSEEEKLACQTCEKYIWNQPINKLETENVLRKLNNFIGNRNLEAINLLQGIKNIFRKKI